MTILDIPAKNCEMTEEKKADGDEVKNTKKE